MKRALIQAMSLSFILGLLGSPLAVAVEPLSNANAPAVGQSVKLYLMDGNFVTGSVQVWQSDRIVIKTEQGDLSLDPKKVTKALQLVAGSPGTAGESNILIPTTTFNKKVDEEREQWKRQLGKRQVGRVVLYASGIAALIGGLAVTVDGVGQRNNAQFKQKGNILTNEDDVNAGNQKVLNGSLVSLGGALLIVGGIMVGNSIGDLKDEGQRKGFSLSMGTRNDPRGIALAYSYRFGS